MAGCASGGAQSGTAKEYPEGPLDKYWMALDSGEEWSQEKFDEREGRVQELIAQCMAKEGFEYIPNVSGGGVIIDETDGDDVEWGSLEFAEQYGYGIVSWPGMETSMTEATVDDYTDPNEGYVESLSDSEQQAYFETLYGKMDEVEDIAFEDGEEAEEIYEYDYDWTTAGCWGQADHEVHGDEDGIGALWDDPEFADMLQALQDMSSEIYEGGQGMSEIDAEWASCMADAGYPGLTSKWDAQTVMADEYSEMQFDGEEWVEPTKEQNDEFQKRETQQAVADWKCADKINFEDRVVELEMKMQEEFVAKYRDQLEAMVAKYGQK